MRNDRFKNFNRQRDIPNDGISSPKDRKCDHDACYGAYKGDTMIVVGLTGSIAMGKSTVASMFIQFGTPVFDADAAVREFYAGEGAKAVEDIFPGVLIEGRVDRERLSRYVICNVGALKRLENLVHPFVAAARSGFVKKASSKGQRLIIVDVPLLLETGDEAAVDIIVVVSASEPLQRARALARDGMTEERLDSILGRQMSDWEKRQRSHFLINTDGCHEDTRAQISQFLRSTGELERSRGRDA
jgi:dephospho-CoA kinase